LAPVEGGVSGSQVPGSGFRIPGFESWIWSLSFGFRVSGSRGSLGASGRKFWVPGSGFQIWGLGFGVLIFGVRGFGVHLAPVVRVQGFRVSRFSWRQWSGFRVSGFTWRRVGLGFRVQALCFRCKGCGLYLAPVEGNDDASVQVALPGLGLKIRD